MELREFDTILKEKLESRKITPSASSWDKLAENLDKEESNTKKSFWWYAIAAVFVGGIAIGGFIFNPGESSINNNGLVKEKKQELEKPVNPSQEILIPKIKTASPSSSSEIVFQKKEVQKSKKPPRKNSASVPVLAQNQQQVPIPVYTEEAIMNKKSPEQDFLAATEDSSSNTTEIDNLLSEAQRNLKTKTFLIRPQNQINAQALLESVEIKDERSAKDRIINTVQEKLIQLASTNRIFN